MPAPESLTQQEMEDLRDRLEAHPGMALNHADAVRLAHTAVLLGRAVLDLATNPQNPED